MKGAELGERYFQHTFPNGLTLLCEKMPGMQSAAMTLLLPAGAASDPADQSGTAAVVGELVLRGAGQRDSRQLTDHLDSLGLQRSSNVAVHHTRFAACGVADKVMRGLEVYADIVRRPHLPEEGFQAARDLSLQSLESIEDEPRQKVSIKLREWHWPNPYGRNPMGEKEHLLRLTRDYCQTDFQRRYHPQDSMIALAGNIDFDQAKAAIEQHFADWKGPPTDPIVLTPPPGNYHFQKQDSEQTHIAIAYKALPENHDEYYRARLAVECLSGGMSGRLFTEVREKRGLCYSVGASYASLKGIGSVLGYAGTSNDRAQATLDCFVSELHRLSDGVEKDELDRAKIGLKASIIMSGESTSSRSGAIAHDFFIRGRIRTLDEISKVLDAVNVDQVNDYLKKNKPGPFTIVIVGPKELKIPS
ncbi:MAG TPA: pitrilysin family protein [Tepidisphaeraceae bacterium]|nr:pitrilysin family protein [Tepidisphaeraceae bacterium]